jgi:hypothetical protein
MNLQPRMKKVNWAKVLPYAMDFRRCVMCSAQGILDGAGVIGRAEADLFKKEKAGLMDELGMSDPEFSMWLTIHKRDQRLREVIWELPPHFSTIYAVATLTDAEFDALKASGILHQLLTRADLKKWITNHRASVAAKEAGAPRKEDVRRENSTAKRKEELNATDAEDPDLAYFAASAAPESDSNGDGLGPGFRKPRQRKHHASIWIAVDMDPDAVADVDDLLAAIVRKYPNDVRIT